MAKSLDITKQAWKFQEGSVYLALCEALGTGVGVWWNHRCDRTPEGMSIDPDILIGNDPQKPDAVVFVTHASAEMAGQKKFWRTVAEVIEIKKLKSHPKVLSVLFAGNVKANLMVAYELLFDGAYHLDSNEEGKSVSELIIDLTKKYGAYQPAECTTVLDKLFVQESAYWNPFVTSIRKLSSSEYGPKHEVVVAISEFKNSRVPKARETSLRRSACKLFTLPTDIQKKLFDNKKIKEVPIHAQILEWFVKEIGGYRLADNELVSFITSSKYETVETIRDEGQKLSTFCSFVENLKGIEFLKICNEWVVDHFDELCTDEGMNAHLIKVFENPYYPLSDRIPEEQCSTTHWLFDRIIYLLRTESGRADGYGYSSLAREINVPRIDLVMTNLVNRKKIEYESLAKVAGSFAKNLERLGRDRVRLLLDESIDTGCRSIFNYNIATYRHFNPLEWIVSKALEAKHLSYEYHQLHPSFLSDEMSGITTTTGNIIKALNGDVWIKCQSAYDGKTDKRKELCGRIGAMKLSYNPSELIKKRFYLVVDGFFNDEDLHLLDVAGWDGIFYYDEMDTLISEIVKI